MTEFGLTAHIRSRSEEAQASQPGAGSDRGAGWRTRTPVDEPLSAHPHALGAETCALQRIPALRLGLDRLLHIRVMRIGSYPDRFGSVADAWQWNQAFFTLYNDEHHHTGLALLTPADVHYGQAAAILATRQAVLQRAYDAHPERFVNGPPTCTATAGGSLDQCASRNTEPMIAPEARSPAPVEPIADATPYRC